MLVLSRKKNESIEIAEGMIKVTVVEVRGDKVRLGVEAPLAIDVHRNEVAEASAGQSTPRICKQPTRPIADRNHQPQRRGMAPKTVHVKMARASDYDVRVVLELMQMLEEVHEYGTYTPPNENEEEISEEVDDARLAELVREKFASAYGSWSRVIFGFTVLRDNCTDPELETLEWRPDIKKLLECL